MPFTEVEPIGSSLSVLSLLAWLVGPVAILMLLGVAATALMEGRARVSDALLCLAGAGSIWVSLFVLPRMFADLDVEGMPTPIPFPPAWTPVAAALVAWLWFVLVCVVWALKFVALALIGYLAWRGFVWYVNPCPEWLGRWLGRPYMPNAFRTRWPHRTLDLSDPYLRRAVQELDALFPLDRKEDA
jgi:hypothetical protein